MRISYRSEMLDVVMDALFLVCLNDFIAQNQPIKVYQNHAVILELRLIYTAIRSSLMVLFCDLFFTFR